MSERELAEALYRAFLDAWNRQDAAGMAALCCADVTMIGFDGSEMIGCAAVQAQLAPIFARHPTPTYVAIVRQVSRLGPETLMLRAAAGLIPRGGADLDPALNAIHTLAARREDGQWRIALFQNTPAAWHGRPNDQAALTAELRERIPTD